MKKIILSLVLFLFASSLFAQIVTHATQNWTDSLYASKAWVNASFVKADYVFDEDYNLLSIDEHSHIMWEAGKLPGVKAHGTLGLLEELEVAHRYIAELKAKLDIVLEKLGDDIGLFQRSANGNLYYMEATPDGTMKLIQLTGKNKRVIFDKCEQRTANSE